jgi:hypothetical protein
MVQAQLDALAATPVVLDLNGDGVHTTSAANGVNFDLEANGTVNKVGWVDTNDGLLALDRNGDGLINNGAELFGSATQTATGTADNGFAAMASMDSNHDGILSNLDLNFDKLKVWVDANHDGISQAGELKGLADYHIASINLNAQAGTLTDNGNLLGLTSSYTTTDGSQHAVADVWFAKDHAATTGTTEAAPKLSDLLAAPTADLAAGLTTSAAAVPAPAEASTVHAAVLPIDKNLQDEYRHLPLI